eukprot:14076004-Alexandrium_andersonii.AAC.1
MGHIAARDCCHSRAAPATSVLATAVSGHTRTACAGRCNLGSNTGQHHTSGIAQAVACRSL